MKTFSSMVLTRWCMSLLMIWASSDRSAAAGTASAFDVAAIDRVRILTGADAALKTEPISVTAHRAKLSEGGPHDFYSNGDYWWPDPSKPDGLPYIQKDGQTNPDNFNHHRMDIRNLRDTVAALGAATKSRATTAMRRRRLSCSVSSSSIPPRG